MLLRSRGLFDSIDALREARPKFRFRVIATLRAREDRRVTRDATRMPSLAGLRAFEAVARLGSIAAAATELGVTDAAVRQHLRGLEDFVGRPLFERHSSGLKSTDEAARFGDTVGAAFRTLRTGVDELLGRGDAAPLRVALTPAFAEHWLMPRLAALWQSDPELIVELVPSIRPVDLKAEGFDLAIRYGQGNWPGCRSERLASARYMVVASEAYLSPDGPLSLTELATCPWLFEKGREEHRRWAEAHDIDQSAAQHRFYPTNSLVLSAARMGHGLSLQAESLVERDLASGVLNVLFSEDSGNLSYYLLTREDRSEKVERFAQWLLGNADSDVE